MQLHRSPGYRFAVTYKLEPNIFWRIFQLKEFYKNFTYIRKSVQMRDLDKSYSGQLVPKTTHNQDNSYPRRLITRTSRTQDNSYPRRLIPRTTRIQDKSYAWQAWHEQLFTGYDNSIESLSIARNFCPGGHHNRCVNFLKRFYHASQNSMPNPGRYQFHPQLNMSHREVWFIAG